MPHVLVVGSSNTDLVMRTPRLPSPGETLLGATFFSVQGGKGANQAVAAARAGAQTTFIARVGKGDFGQQALLSLQKENIHTNHILADPDLPSGVAFILVDEKGENSIIVASGANAALSPIQLDAAENVFRDADICLLQLETPLDTVLHATLLASQCQTPVILNPAPATQLPKEIWPHLFLITPNETETEMLTGISPNTDQNAQKAAQVFLDRGVQNVIMTLGARGALMVTPTQTTHIATPQVTPVDTTAAGDAFNGALAYALASGQPLADAARFACVAGALTVTQAGAQPAIPNADQIWQLLKNQ
jgi:ribokinase